MRPRVLGDVVRRHADGIGDLDEHLAGRRVGDHRAVPGGAGVAPRTAVGLDHEGTSHGLQTRTPGCGRGSGRTPRSAGRSSDAAWRMRPMSAEVSSIRQPWQRRPYRRAAPMPPERSRTFSYRASRSAGDSRPRRRHGPGPPPPTRPRWRTAPGRGSGVTSASSASILPTSASRSATVAWAASTRSITSSSTSSSAACRWASEAISCWRAWRSFGGPLARFQPGGVPPGTLPDLVDVGLGLGELAGEVARLRPSRTRPGRRAPGAAVRVPPPARALAGRGRGARAVPA